MAISIEFPRLSKEATEALRELKELITVDFDLCQFIFKVNTGPEQSKITTVRFDAPVDLIEDMILGCRK